MAYQLNQYGQPVGLDVPDWNGCLRPSGETLSGKYCRLEQVNPALHGDDLYSAYQQAADSRDWTYLSVGPFADRQGFETYLQQMAVSRDPIHYTVIDQQNGKALGTLALMRIDQKNGVIEVGFVTYSPDLKRSRIATEAQFLLMFYALDSLGYRRYEWKCDALNAPSRAAALRLGFQFEGIFRNHVIYKGHTRDTAWFSIIDNDWARLKPAYLTWLNENNFDENGKQKTRLSELI
ncbi:MAG: GNAT family N-acetyltransferase [Enterobacteriaceae bacterium]|jgi:RimJ/RimL family protein N-acetyltransferase|nr:GNAT family N-acetyltransferase [Enterobacteriaceae bacterium]